MTRDKYYDSLQHHGILGMKWGIRRYQNEDGTLTDIGKKRYSSSDTAITKYGENTNIVVTKPKRYREGDKGSYETTHKMYVNGKKVAIAYLDTYGNKSHINWISAMSKTEGKGYAQAMMGHLIQYSKDTNGSTVVTLEVPEFADNARHIYEKFGFEDTGVIEGNEWLTGMKKQL